MSRKRNRNDTKRPLPSMKGFESPERTHAQPRTVTEQAPGQKQKNRNMRARQNPEFMQTKHFWMAPHMVYEMYGLRGFLLVLSYEMDDTGKGGLYDKREVAQIRHVIEALARAEFKNSDQLTQLVKTLILPMTFNVRQHILELLEAYVSVPLRF